MDKTIEYGLSLGSNLGERLAQLQECRSAIRRLPGTVEVASSSVYETEPVGVADIYSDMPYLNAVLIVSSLLPVSEMAQCLRSIEVGLGRRRTDDRNAPRTIDADIIYAGQMVIAEDRLVVPHHRWNERRFVVEPLAECRGGMKLPGVARSVEQVLASLPNVPCVDVHKKIW